jgi:hypothetical protein
VSSRTRSRARNARPDDARLAVLRGALADVADAPFNPHTHARRAARLAITFRPAGRESDDVEDAALPLDDLRMFALAHRACADRSGAIVRRMPLAIYRPAVDLPGTGRISFEWMVAFDLSSPGDPDVRTIDPAENATAARAGILLAQAVEDADARDLAPGPLLPEFYYAFDRRRRPVFEARFTRQEWAAAEVRIGDMRAWPAGMFARDLADRYEVNPVDGSPRPDLVGLDEHPSWCLRDGVWLPRAQAPDEIYTYLSPFRGREVRNPAYAVLRRRGVVPAGVSYKQWLDTVTTFKRGEDGPAGRVPLEDDGEPNGVSRHRDALMEYGSRWAGGDAELVADLVVAAGALGVPVADEAQAADMLLAPWTKAVAPRAASIQVVRLAGMPGPETMDFEAGACSAYLYDLGPVYASVDPRRVVESVQQRSRRRPPAWKAGRQTQTV